MSTSCRYLSGTKCINKLSEVGNCPLLLPPPRPGVFITCTLEHGTASPLLDTVYPQAVTFKEEYL